MSKNIIMNVLAASGYEEMYPFNPSQIINASVENTTTASNYNLTVPSFTQTLTNVTGNPLGIICFICTVNSAANATITLNNNTPYPILLSNGSNINLNTLVAGRLVFVKYYNQKYYLIGDKSQIGLASVDDTSDLNKPISIATQNALNNKLNTPQLIPANSNLNTYQTAGLYYVSTNSQAATITNTPIQSAFSLFVEIHSGAKQTLTNYNTSGVQIWVRNFNNGTWSPWYQQAFVLSGIGEPNPTLGLNGNLYLKINT